MVRSNTWLHHPVSRILQHLAFWVLSFIVFVQLFKTGASAEKIDYIYTALFHATLLPAVYLNLEWLLPRLANNRQWPLYVAAVVVLVGLFSWLNYSFFQSWSTRVFPDYFFISYFTIWQVALFFVVYVAISSLLKLSRSWFRVNELQRQLLQSEKEKVHIELQALKAQIKPHFFFNTLNGIYSMSLDKDDRLPQTVLRLSHLMRYFLYEAKEDLVPLEKEWQVLQDYMALQKIRSGSHVQIEVQLEGDIDQQQIAPLLLITFLENAFKHGARSNTQAAFIRLFLQVRQKDITFKLENSKELVDDIEQTNYQGVGLGNVQRRLALLYAGKHQLQITNDPDLFIVTLQLHL